MVDSESLKQTNEALCLPRPWISSQSNYLVCFQDVHACSYNLFPHPILKCSGFLFSPLPVIDPVISSQARIRSDCVLSGGISKAFRFHALWPDMCTRSPTPSLCNSFTGPYAPMQAFLHKTNFLKRRGRWPRRPRF